ncbi:MAG: hypothetical protein GY710_24145 [Desulfobacteraceae bacterium]|nr:hypothetical protein [Desulfobacteraceae bacterium]
MLRTGEGAAEGGFGGYFQDTLRTVGIVFALYGPVSKVKEIIRNGRGLKNEIINRVVPK